MKRKLAYGKKVMIARMSFKDGFVVPLHHRENEQITNVISGAGNCSAEVLFNVLMF